MSSPIIAGDRSGTGLRSLWLVPAVWGCLIAQCVSLARISETYEYLGIRFDLTDTGFVLRSLALLLTISLVFAATRFSFGYLCGILVLTLVANFIWLSHDSVYLYDYDRARRLAIESLIAFLIPALTMPGYGGAPFSLTERQFRALNWTLLVLVAATLLCAAGYNFQLVNINDIYEFRNEIELPGYVAYLWNISINVILPFTFASFLVRRNWWGVVISLLLPIGFYPVTLSKMAFFLPPWLVAFAVVTRWLETRLAIIILLASLTLAGVVATYFDSGLSSNLIAAFNFRFLAVPANSLEHYLDFFSKFEATHFCHISFLMKLMDCPYDEQLSLVMSDYYKVGNINASFIATEGVAAFGMAYMPLMSFLAGMLIGIGNIVSKRLPSRFVAVSAAMIVPNLLNIPMPTLLLTGGYLVLLVLWALTPGVPAEVSEAIAKAGADKLANADALH
jgi:hypothetical protein